jgi:hypothetical protein
LEADLIELQRKYSCVAWAFESNNAYEYMRSEFVKNAMGQGVILPLHSVIAKEGMEVLIGSLEPHICGLEPNILIHPRLTTLIEQLNQWPEPRSEHHYDGMVALYLLWSIAVLRGGRSASFDIKTFRHKDLFDMSGYDDYGHF